MANQVSIVDLLSGLDGGNVNYQLELQLAEVVKAVKEHQKKGKVSLTISIEPQPAFGKSAVALSAIIKADVPRPDYSKTIKFVDDSGNLIGQDPNQGTFGQINTSFKAAGAE